MNSNFGMNNIPVPPVRLVVDSDNRLGSSSEHSLVKLNRLPSFDHSMSDQSSRSQGRSVVTTDFQQSQNTHIRAKTVHQCETCGKQLFLQVELIKHRRIHIKVTPYFCDICRINFNTKNNLRGHHRRYHASKVLFAIASTSNNLTPQALGEVPDIVKYSCTGIEASTVSLSVDPANRPEPSPSFENSLSSDDLSYFDYLMSDQYLLLSNRVAAVTNTLISREAIASTSKNLIHKAPSIVNDSGTGSEATANIDPFIKVPINPKVRSDSRLHISGKRICTKEKSSICTTCGGGFVSRKTLIEHEKIHTGNKPFICILCGDSFIHKNQLKRHEGVHAESKLFPCDVCDKYFRHKDSIRRHKRIHTAGAQRYQCDFCNKNYTRNYSLTVHIKSIHPKEKNPIPAISEV